MNEFNIIEKNNKYISVSKNNNVFRFDIYPLDMSRPRPPEEYVEITSKCLRDRLINRNSTSPRTLLGLCNENSITLLKSLARKGYNAKLCLGVNKSAGREISLVDAFENIKNVHQWIELRDYTLEICSEANQCSGKMYVSKRRPNNYKLYHKLTFSEFQSLNVNSIKVSNINNVIKKLK